MKKLFILFVAAAMLAVSLIGSFSASAANGGATPDEAIRLRRHAYPSVEAGDI